MSALKNVSKEQAQSAQWMEWKTNAGRTVAFAVDPTSVARTGKLRAFNGSLIPESAVPAMPGTERDHFSLALIERIIAGDIGKRKGKTPSPEVLAAREKRAAEKAEKAAQKAQEKATRKAERDAKIQAQREVKQAEKAAQKAAAKPATPTAPGTSDGQFPATDKTVHADSTPGSALRSARPPRKEGYEVMLSGKSVGWFPLGKLIETEDAADPKVTISGKSWAVYQGKDRKAFGLLETPKA